MPQPKPNSKKM